MGTGVYAIVHCASGKQYIGSAVAFSDRWHRHRYLLRKNQHHSLKLQAAWNKYGEGAFEFTLLLHCARADLLMYEQRALDAYRPVYNIAAVAGSPMMGRKHSPETRAQLSAMRAGKKRKPHSAETRARLSAAAKLRPPVTSEVKAKLSALSAGKKRKPLSAEHRAKIARSHLGKVREPQTALHVARRVASTAATKRRKL